MKNLIISLLLVGQVFAQTTKYHKIITTPSHDYFYLRVGDFNADSVMKPKNMLRSKPINTLENNSPLKRIIDFDKKMLYLTYMGVIFDTIPIIGSYMTNENEIAVKLFVPSKEEGLKLWKNVYLLEETMFINFKTNTYYFYSRAFDINTKKGHVEVLKETNLGKLTVY